MRSTRSIAVVALLVISSCGRADSPQVGGPLGEGGPATISSPPPIDQLCRFVADKTIVSAADARLAGVSASSSSDVWAVGGENDVLALHFNGTSWTKTAAPVLKGDLRAVAPTSARGAWAVGGGEEHAYALTWNGSAWKSAADVPGASGIAFEDVSLTSSTAGWAVGFESPDGVHDKTLIVRLEDKSRMSSPNPGAGRNRLNAVAALNKKDAWAAGATSSKDDVSGRALLLHWDGRRWNTVRAPAPKGSSWAEIFGLHAFSSKDVWAVGHYDDKKGRHALVLRWNGTNWRIVPSPAVGATGTRGFAPPFGPVLERIDGVSPTDVWAVGHYQIEAGGGLLSRALAIHWNGKRWTIAEGLETATDSSLRDVVVVGAGQAWAVGYETDDVETHALAARLVCVG